MDLTKPFQKLFSGRNTEENTPTPKTASIQPSYSNAVQSTHPDPTPETTGGGVGMCRLNKNKIDKDKCGVGVGGGGEGEREEEEGEEKGRKVILTERDREILGTCYEQSFLLKSHIETFFRGCTQRRVNFRMMQLIEGGFLLRESYPELGFHELFRLTKNGRKMMRQRSSHGASFPAQLKTNTLFHDALVTSCRLRISKFWNAEFICEQMLKAWGTPEIPDGIWRFPTGKMIALEVECSDKGRRRFLTRLGYLGKVDAISFVLYVVPNDRMLAIVSKYLTDSPSDQPAGVVHWDALVNDDPKVTTVQGMFDLFSKREW